MTGNGHNTQEELASYAMQNLPPEESASIRAHLQTCAECRTELAQVCGDLALLGLAVDQQPLPEGARDRFLQRIAGSLRDLRMAQTFKERQLHRTLLLGREIPQNLPDLLHHRVVLDF